MQPFFISKQYLFRFFGIYKGGGNFPISIARYYNFWVAVMQVYGLTILAPIVEKHSPIACN
jgi:hypothetical protein